VEHTPVRVTMPTAKASSERSIGKRFEQQNMELLYLKHAYSLCGFPIVGKSEVIAGTTKLGPD
jgi:hypothetical protein